MEGWLASKTNIQKLNSRAPTKENDMLMGTLLSHKSNMELMQNCDLPPPMKVFSGSDHLVLSSMNRVFGMMGKEQEEFGNELGEDDHDKLELLKALRLSQTRAREAERKAAGLAQERDDVSKAFLQQSLQVLAYRQWIRLLEVEVMKLRQQWKQHQQYLIREENDGGNGGSSSWIVALAFCFGIAGVGLAFGCRYWL